MPEDRLVTHLSAIHPRKHIISKLVFDTLVLLVTDRHTVIIELYGLGGFDVVILGEE